MPRSIKTMGRDMPKSQKKQIDAVKKKIKKNYSIQSTVFKQKIDISRIRNLKRMTGYVKKNPRLQQLIERMPQSKGQSFLYALDKALMATTNLARRN
jgi:hypothetical protein